MGNKAIRLGGGQAVSATRTETYRDVSCVAGVIYRDRPVPNGSTKSTAIRTVDKLVDVVAVQNALRNVFTWLPGERVLLPEFGSELPKLLYRGITPDTEAAIVAEINHCVSEWEPRVVVDKVVNVGSVSDTEDNTIHLEVRYRIRGLSGETFAYAYDYTPAE